VRSSRALLICAGGGIGDSLLSTVVARALRSRSERVDAMTLPGHREALLRVPDLDDVLVDDGRNERDLARELAARSYDAAVVTWATPRIARVAQAARIPVRVGQARRLYSFRFTKRVTVRSELGDVTTHWTQILLDYARALGCDTADTFPRFVPTPEDEDEAAALRSQLVPERAYAIVHVANAVASRRGRWPLEGWVSLVRAIQTRYGLPVVLGGSQADRAMVEPIAANTGARVVAGRVSIGGFGALTKGARFFAGISTGSMHVAAAVGTPTAGIFPFQTDVPDRWSPHGPRTAVVRATYPCRPGERKETCPDYACVAHLNVPRILATIDELLSR
jgi:heptosyltransferase-2/heptosyltransferase-3